jgi:hypothetical protein
MPPLTSPSRPRRFAVLALAAFLLAAGTARSQDAKTVLDKIKSGAGLAKVKETLAADPAGARVRIDSFALDQKTIKVAGVVLVPGASDEDGDAIEKAARAKVVAVAQEVAGAKDFKGFDTADIKAVRGDKMPHLQLQKAANDAGKTDPAADELRFTDAKFDAKGQLVVTGQRGNNARTKEWLDANAAKALAANAAALGPDGKPAVVLDVRAPEKGAEWPLSPSVIQKGLAGANQPGLARLRVDRAYLVASPAKPDETNPTGVSWSYVLSGIAIGTQPVPKADVDRITKEVMPAAFAAAKWAPITSGDLDKLTVADNRVPDPGPKFQVAVAGKPSLDGIRLDARTEFGADGKLVVIGVQPGLDAKGEEALAATIRAVLDALATGSDGNALYKKLGEHGVSTVKLDRVKVRELHAELRQWAAEKLDETRLARLYFDENGWLTLTCDSPTPGVDALAKAELKRRAATHGVPVAPPAAAPAPEGMGGVPPATVFISAQEPKKPADPKKQPAGPDPLVKPSAAPLKRSLTAFLQEQITDPKATKWDAVLIERGFFNDKNQFTLRGVVNTEAQKTELSKLLAALAKDAEWANYFTPAPAAEPDLEVIPMGKLVERVARVAPAYDVFDGVRVTGAKYVFEKDAKGAPGQTLVFVAHLVGRTDRDAPATLRALIAEDAKVFGRRLPQGRTIRFEKAPGQVAASDELGDLSIAYAAQALDRGEMAKAKEWIELGQLHHPGESAVWFLSAYYNHLRGDEELVRRDLYRTIAVEGRLDANNSQRKRRYAAAKDLQGEKRDELEKLWLKCWKEVKDGAKPIKFAKEK